MSTSRQKTAVIHVAENKDHFDSALKICVINC